MGKPRGRPKGSKNKPKVDTFMPEAEKTALEKEIILARRNAVRRKKAGEPAKVYNLIKDYENEDSGPPKGNPTGICTRCKREFEQPFSKEHNSYSSWKICPECRKKKSKKMEEKIASKSGENGQEEEVNVGILPYAPYPWQKEVEEAFWNHRFTVMACGNRCLLPGTFIDGCNKNVENLIPGDIVISKDGKRQKVTYVDTEPYAGNIYAIKPYGLEPIKCNSNHPILVAYGEKESRDDRVKIVKEEFVPAEKLFSQFSNMGKLERIYVKIPRIKGTVNDNYWSFDPFTKNLSNPMDGIRLTEEIAWMLGLYCAEGCFLVGSGCKWTLNYNEPELALKLHKVLTDLGLHVNVRGRPDEGTRSLIVSQMQFCRKLDNEIGHGSLNKRIPDSILYNTNENLLVAFLKGYYDGDGWVSYKDAKISVTSVSKTLAHQLQIAWARIGVFAKITTFQRERKTKAGDICNKEYTVNVNSSSGIQKIGYNVRTKKELKTAIITDNAIYSKISNIDFQYGETKIIVVSTEDETFTACGFVQHNSGKDRATIMIGIKYFVACLNENRHIEQPDMVPPVLWWQIAPTEKMARQNWRELKQYFPKDWIVACSDSNFQLETIGGGIIEVRSAYDPLSLRGVGLDLATITEAALIKDLNLLWPDVEARLNSPARGLKGRGGKALINSSPLGLNDFYDMFQRGQPSSDTYSSEWWSCRYPWTCNPANKELAEKIIVGKYGSMTYEESMRRQMGERTFRSNYLADFMAEDGSVFKNFEDNCVISVYNESVTGCHTREEIQAYIKKWQEPIPGDQYVIGYDPATGSSQDSPVIVVRHRKTGNIVNAYDLYGKKYKQQFDFIAGISQMYNYAEVHWLRTGHTAIEGEFSNRGVSEIPVDEQGQNKGRLVQTLELAVENSDVHVLNDGSVVIQTLIEQMKDYTETNGKYANNKCPHDDFCSAMYAAFSDYSVMEVPIFYSGLMYRV